MKLSEIKPQDDLTIFDKQGRKVRERQGKYVSGNADFLTIQFLYYKDSLSLTDLSQGKAAIFKDKEVIEFASVNKRGICKKA